MADLIITREKKNPTETLVCNLREQISRPLVLKIGSVDAEKLAKKVQTMYDKGRGDWFNLLGRSLIYNHVHWAPIPDKAFTLDDFNFTEDIRLIIETFKREMNIDTERPPKQRNLSV